MFAGLSGSLFSHDALARLLVDASEEHRRGRVAYQRLRAWHSALQRQLGPTAPAREVFDRLAVPLAANLGYRIVPLPGSHGWPAALLHAGEVPVAVLVVTPWGQDAATTWRDAVRQGISCGLRWCVCVTGPTLRIADAVRTYSRRFAEFDLAVTFEDERTFMVLWTVLAAPIPAPNASAIDGGLDLAVRVSESHRAEVRGALQSGVHEAVHHLLVAFAKAAARVSAERAFEEALTVIYRILFLLFAEARGLVPQWHPLYGESYTVERLRAPVERLERPRGLWETLQAVARLAHQGCRAGALRMPPFNGRLFSPAHAPLADAVPLEDSAVREALLSLTTRPAAGGRVRIAYADLGVEQLGGVYERLLDFAPALKGPDGRPTLVRAERRKTTGTFYTPRTITEYVVRRTLAPLVAGANVDQILSLRVLDAAMGSGAFLVAACRYLAAAYEAALVNEGRGAYDITDAERAAFRRVIAQRCLFGVDINPTAVQLARLSLWLATLAADRPLTFLDHHLRTGNSLAGASLRDIVRNPVPYKRHTARDVLPLFPSDVLDAALQQTRSTRLAIAEEPGETIEQVRSKERALARLGDRDAKLAPWTDVANLWCAAWFADRGDAALRGAFNALADRIVRGDPSLPAHVADPLLNKAAAIASREQFFHWELEFPEVFDTEGGHRRGFDAVIGNPPWEMLRGDRGDENNRAAAHDAAARLATFARTSGTYRLPGDGHANLFQLFVDRALGLARDGGRIGLVLPWGFAVDHGCGALRRYLFERTSVDTFVSLDNRDAVFPIHRSLKFLLLTTTTGGSTHALPARLAIRSPADLDAFSDAEPPKGTVWIPRPTLERFSGPSLAVPELRSADDLRIVSSIASAIPALGDPDGWGVHFGRELNATDDRRHFTSSRSGLPVIEGKQISPFTVDLAMTRWRLPHRTAERLLDPARTYRRPRLAYRDVASPTNRLTLIAAIVPAGAVTTHTLFCLREIVADEVQQFLCGVFNSYVANYLIRLRVTTHVGAGVIERLPVPRPGIHSPQFHEVVRLNRHLCTVPSDHAAGTRLQALCARLYGLDGRSFCHVLDTFPLIHDELRTASLQAFHELGKEL